MQVKREELRQFNDDFQTWSRLLRTPFVTFCGLRGDMYPSPAYAPSGAGMRLGVSAHTWPPSRMTEKPSLTGSCWTWCLAPRAHSLFSRRPGRPAVDASTPYWTDRRDLSRSLRLPGPRATQSPVKVAPPCVWKTLLVKCDVDQGKDDAPSQGQVR